MSGNSTENPPEEKKNYGSVWSSRASLMFTGKQDTVTENKLSPRRWFILSLFVFCSTLNAFQWIQYSIIANVIQFYYNVDLLWVDWTSMVYLIVYVPLIFPGVWLLNAKRGLRLSIILGSCGTMIGAWIKCGSIRRELFLVAFIGQTVSAVSQVFILGIPSRLSAVWFGSMEVSTACGIGVFGNQLGIALGFLIPPEVVQMGNVTTLNENEIVASITREFQILHYSNAGICTLIFLLILVFFSDHPKIPPSAAALEALQQKEDYGSSLRNLITNKNYVILLISYGINAGSFYTISTLLNQVFLTYFPGHEQDAGRIGLTIVVTGMVGSVICGYWLDKTHKFKLTTLVIYLFSCAGMVTYTFIFKAYNIGLVYFVSGVLGFFMTGYLPVGFEFAAELTYPASEGMSSGLLNASSQLIGAIFIICCGIIMRKYDGGDVYANLYLVGSLGLGFILSAFIQEELRRQKVQKNSTNENSLNKSNGSAS